MTESIDLTPQGLLTAEGVLRVNIAQAELESATVAFANEASEFFKQHRDTILGMAGDNAALREDIHQIDAMISARHRKTDAFLRAVAGVPDEAGLAPDNVFTLTRLQYAEAGDGPWAMYIFGEDGHHSGRHYFSKKAEYPEEQIPVVEAKIWAESAMAQGHEVRICDGGDMLVFHFENGKIVYGENFWKTILGE